MHDKYVWSGGAIEALTRLAATLNVEGPKIDDEGFHNYKSVLRYCAQRAKEIKEATEVYEKDPVNAHDKPSSWGKLSVLIKLIKG
ncbi:MAG: hypothetical protein V3T23_00045 [Nitrososphaerales archaeon]